MINLLVELNRRLRAAGMTQLEYSLGETGDSLYLLLLEARLLPNRLPASWEVLHNRQRGFWLSIFASAATVFWAVFYLPLGGIDLPACLFIVSALRIGRLGRESIVSTQKG